MDGPGRAKRRTFGFVGLRGFEQLPQQAVIVRSFIENGPNQEKIKSELTVGLKHPGTNARLFEKQVVRTTHQRNDVLHELYSDRWKSLI